MAITVRALMLSDIADLDRESDRFSLGRIPRAILEDFVRRPGWRLAGAFDDGDLIAWSISYVETDALGPYLWYERLDYRQRLQDGVDGDGDPRLGPVAAEAFGRLIRNAMMFYGSRGVTRGRYKLPPKMFTRVKQLYADPRFNMTVTITRDDHATDAQGNPVGWHDVEVTYGP